MRSPYIEAAKMAFMIAGGAGLAVAAIKGIGFVATKGVAGIMAGLMGIGSTNSEECVVENPETKTDETTV